MSTSRRIALLAVSAAFAGLSLTGCAPTTADKEATVTADEIETALQQKPPLEAAQADYRTAVEAMANEIAALTPGTTWAFDTQIPWLSCGGDYAATEAKHAYISAGFDQPIDDAIWPQALQIVKDGAAKYGATNFVVFKDQPGNHDVAISNDDGVQFQLGTKVKASLTAKSDCRLNTTQAPG